MRKKRSETGETDRHSDSYGAGQAHLRIGSAERDIIALGIAIAAIIMFVGTGGAVLPQVVRSMTGTGGSADAALTNALLLNIALIIFGWRRYRQLRAEIQQRRLAEERAQMLAETDSLTGCLNRRTLTDRTELLRLEAGQRGEAIVLMMIDLDNFKQINDYNGHRTGDEVLLTCARRISTALPHNAVLSRLGGDEFACAFPTAADSRDFVEHVATSTIQAICQPVAVNGSTITVSASLGIAQHGLLGAVDDCGADAKTLLHMADIAMYHAKKQGKNGHSWFERPMEDELRYRKDLEEGIRRGILRGEFVPFYEQQIDLATGELTGFEMLARWQSPSMGLVSPDVFIPIAEDIGAIGDLSEAVIGKALEDACAWDPRLTLAVNISPLQLRDAWFAQKILKLLVKANFPPERFEIEIAESCLHENMAAVRSLMASLRNQGIRVTLDDFGTGYSSVGQLHDLPFDRIKIDRRFVTDLTLNREAGTIVRAIAMLGKGLGLPVAAEGIETTDVLDELKRFDNMKGQGYLYGRPEPGDVVRAKLATRGLLMGGATEAAAAPAPIQEAAAPLPVMPRLTGTG